MSRFPVTLQRMFGQKGMCYLQSSCLRNLLRLHYNGTCKAVLSEHWNLLSLCTYILQNLIRHMFGQCQLCRFQHMLLHTLLHPGSDIRLSWDLRHCIRTFPHRPPARSYRFQFHNILPRNCLLLEKLSCCMGILRQSWTL